MAAGLTECAYGGRWSPVAGVAFVVQPGPGLVAGRGGGPEQVEHAAGSRAAPGHAPVHRVIFLGVGQPLDDRPAPRSLRRHAPVDRDWQNLNLWVARRGTHGG